MIHRIALDLPPEEWKTYSPNTAILQRQSATHSQLESRRKQALRVARQAASLLRKEFDARKVVLFGSLAVHGNFTLWYDIDLAVFGLPADRFYAAVAAITGLSAEFKVDLIDAEECKTSLRDAIDRDGIAL
ncbi:MAG: nucleotidyltransferase domain-containing protein [Anaerolineaceae bacterium]|nr:nucleotidyltransferase domain-containing protein [Anaerolineaceae bacterium]